MSPNTILHLYERLETLVRRLPGPLQKVVTEELSPVKQIFLAQRPARLVLLGQPKAPAERLFSALVNSQLDISHLDGPSAWRLFHHRGVGGFRLLDGRRLTDTSHSWRELESALGEEKPDLLLFLADGTSDFDLALECEQASRVVELCRTRYETAVPMIGILDLPKHLDPSKRSERLLQLRAWLDGQAQFRPNFVRAIAVSSFARFRQDGTLDTERDDRENIDALAELLVRELPEDAQVDLARLFRVGSVQRATAQRLVRSISAVAAAVGAQPIPLADFPILTGLQLAMVSGVMYLGGRELSLRSAAEFCAALGSNIGLGMVFREGARAAVKILPGWGNVVSGGIAAGGTYAIGRAAIGFFIEGKTLAEARGMLKTFRRKKGSVPVDQGRGSRR
ncbi:MAG TPA: hypothetical protein VGD78_14720 [Chthoniobacterales bacterium]